MFFGFHILRDTNLTMSTAQCLEDSLELGNLGEALRIDDANGTALLLDDPLGLQARDDRGTNLTMSTAQCLEDSRILAIPKESFFKESAETYRWLPPRRACAPARRGQ